VHSPCGGVTAGAATEQWVGFLVEGESKLFDAERLMGAAWAQDYAAAFAVSLATRRAEWRVRALVAALRGVRRVRKALRKPLGLRSRTRSSRRSRSSGRSRHVCAHAPPGSSSSDSDPPRRGQGSALDDGSWSRGRAPARHASTSLGLARVRATALDRTDAASARCGTGLSGQDVHGEATPVSFGPEDMNLPSVAWLAQRRVSTGVGR
jgi:hypothetical protein